MTHYLHLPLCSAACSRELAAAVPAEQLADYTLFEAAFGSTNAVVQHRRDNEAQDNNLPQQVSARNCAFHKKASQVPLLGNAS